MNRKMRMLLALAALLGSPLAQNGMAADWAAEWQVTQTGENFDGVWSGGPRDNLVGGGSARLAGGGDNAEVLHTGTMTSAAPMLARLSGGGDNQTIVYDAVPSGVSPTVLAARRP